MFQSLDPVDRERATEFLRHRLTARDLREVLKTIQGRQRRKTVEWIVAETGHSGAGRLPSRLPDGELAAFLIDLAGLELLTSREARYRIARTTNDDELDRLHEYPSQNRSLGGREAKAKAIAARSWYPGKSWPRHFTTVLGLPAAFAGLSGAPNDPPTEEVTPFRPLPTLQDFQLDLKDQVLAVLSGPVGGNRGILNLPTGAGKTRTAVEALVEWLVRADNPPTILWIAQSDELCEQAVQAFREVWIDLGHRSEEVRSSLTIYRYWGNRKLDDLGPGIVVATIQKLDACRRKGDSQTRELARLAACARVIVVDEAHRILAPSYGLVLRAMGLDPAPAAHCATPLLGLTATPFRSDETETRRLAASFHHRLLHPTGIGDNPIAELRSRGVLSKADHQVLEYRGQRFSIGSEPKYREYFEQFQDLHPDLLQELGEERGRNEKLIEQIMALPKDWPVLFFGCSVGHASAIAVLLRRRGRAAETVTSETRSATRRFLINEFREGRLSVLCNYGVLTTGFDAPRVRALVVARPTASMVLYEQMIGRGMRGPAFGGTEECLVIDVADNLDIAESLAFRRFAAYWVR